MGTLGILRAQSDSAPTDSADYTLKTPYHTEEEWVVASVCRNAYEMLSFMVDKQGEVITPDQVTLKKIDGPTPAYEITLHGKKTTVDATLYFPGSIWSSVAYVPFCRAAMTQLKYVPGVAASSALGTPLTALLDFTDKSIEAENQRVSQALTADPADSLTQQQAALVLVALAMKENSGWFWDPRDICNHAIAHLAVARSLAPNKPLSPEGQMAECCVGLIDDTKKECTDEIAQMAKIPSPPDGLAAWLQASRMRNSRDWRVVAHPENASGLEQVEYFRALSEAVNVDQAINWLKTNSIPDRQDWVRLVLESRFSVDVGQIYAMGAISKEIVAMRATFPDRYKNETLISELNETPGDVLETDATGARYLKVISHGMWSLYYQRHICHAIVETSDFLWSKWGVPDEARLFDGKIAGYFSSLSLFPYVLQVNSTLHQGNDDPKSRLAAFTLHPEWAPDFIDEQAATNSLDLAQFHPMVQAWFSPPILSGTAYVAANRLDSVGASLRTQPTAIDKLYAIAPLQFQIAERELKLHFGEHPTFAQVQQVLGPMIDYYLAAAAWASDAADITFDQRMALEEKSAAMDPERYWDLAQDCLKAGKQDEAADAYQKWYDKGTDRTAVSNEMGWLVNYYYDHGQKDKALAIANYCAQVYSFAGLLTMSKLQARMGNFDQAEDYAQKISDRYNEPTILIGLYHQLAATDPKYQAKFDDAILTVFPYGLKKVTLASFDAPPTSGMRFGQTSASMSQWGLSSDQVVVALDGYQVGSVAQYSTVRGFSDSPAMTFIVWDGTAYREIKATQPDRRFGVDMNNFSQ